jgi:hypothetical protein
MDDSDVNRYPENTAPCHRFAASGNCSGCQNEHHPNLNPALVGMVVPQQYRVPNEVGVACQPCLENLREASRSRSNIIMILTWHSVTNCPVILQMSVILAQSVVTLAVTRSTASLQQTEATMTPSIDRCSSDADLTSTSLHHS